MEKRDAILFFVFFGLTAIFSLLGRILGLNWLLVLSTIALTATFVIFVVGFMRTAFIAQNRKQRKKTVFLWILFALCVCGMIYAAAPVGSAISIINVCLMIMIGLISVIQLTTKSEEKKEMPASQ